jgi:radical SAM superfamily enzyme YgiQ (UPF0313 family)
MGRRFKCIKILLISPFTVHKGKPGVLWLPLGLSFIAAVLRREGRQVAIYDRFSMQNVLGPDRQKVNAAMLRKIKEFEPDWIGLNTLSPLIYDTVECVSLIRQVFAGPVIAGGHHATVVPELTLRKIPGLNGLVQGEGELAMTLLANGVNPAAVPGVWWRKENNGLVNTSPEQIKDLDSLPFPQFDLLDMAFYTRPTLSTVRGYYLSTVSLLASRGCAQNCDFCTESTTYGKGVRFHSPEYVVDWMKKMISDYNIEGIYFHDNNFLLNQGWAGEICERILADRLEKKVKWAIQARADCINRDILKLLKRAGCVKIEIGAETSSQRQLNSVNKKTTVQVNEKAITLCKIEKINVHANIIAGFEQETASDLDEKLQWLKRVKPDTISVFPLNINPGTVLYQRRGNSFFEKNEWTKINIEEYYLKNEHVPGLTRAELNQWLKRSANPHNKWRRRINIIKVNPTGKLLWLIGRKVKTYLLNHMGREG